MSRALVIMFPLSLSLAVICLSSIWTTEYAAGCGDQQIEIEKRCCDLCPPGTYMKEICSEHHQTICNPCEEGYYSNIYDMFDRCEKCLSCKYEYAEKCTSTTNAKCSCRSGFLCSNKDCLKCVENKCVAGDKLKMTVNSSGEYSYQCEPSCTDDKYFDVKEGVCKLRTQCSILGLAEHFPGNKTHNSVCDGGERHRNGKDFIHVILGIGFVLLSLTLLVFLSHACIKTVRKHKAPNNPIGIAAVSTNTSDFNLSKEESGLQFIIQDEFKNSDSVGQLLLEKVMTC